MNPYESTTTGIRTEPHERTLGEDDPSPYPEIDLNKFPPPKDSTLGGRIGLEPKLIVAKGFYFFFYAAFGSLFPLLGLYFKQAGLNGAQAGILAGIRPIIEFISAPLLIGFAQRQNKLRALMFLCLLCWIALTFPLGSISPEPIACLSRNKSHLFINKPEVVGSQNIQKRNADWEEPIESQRNFPIGLLVPIDERIDKALPILIRRKRKIPKEARGVTPYKINELYIHYDPDTMFNWVSPSYSNLIFRKDDVGKAFLLLLVLMILGETLASPAIVIFDGRILEFLGNAAPERYGHQRMFGQLGWAIAIFFVGIALDDRFTFPVRKCELYREKNYTVCFPIFVVLMFLATIIAWKLGPFSRSQIDLDQIPPILATSSSIEHTDKESRLPPDSTIFAQANRSKVTQLWNSVKHFKRPRSIAFLIVAWLMGSGIGLIFTFLFWHLQEIGGSPTLFGIASGSYHISEIVAYFYSSTFISCLGHVKVLCLGLLLNVFRFLYISFLANPWWVLPFEFVQGLIQGTVWAGCCSYLSHNTPPDLRQTSQGLLNFLYHGLGRGFGAIVGGIFVSIYGTTTTFRLYAALCALVLAMFIFINTYRKESGGFIRDLPAKLDSHNLVEETGCIAPHGVPGEGGMERASSNVRLEDQGMTKRGGVDT